MVTRHAHTWLRYWLCNHTEVTHISPQECGNGWHAYVCETCKAPGYAIPSDMAEVFE